MSKRVNDQGPLSPPLSSDGHQNGSSIDPIRALIWSAVINGVTSVPIMVLMMVLMMLMASNPKVMGTFVTPVPLRVLGWLSTGVMAAAVIAMFIFI